MFKENYNIDEWIKNQIRLYMMLKILEGINISFQNYNFGFK